MPPLPATQVAKPAKDLFQATVLLAELIDSPSMGSVPVPMASSTVGTCITSNAPRSATQLAEPVPARLKLSALPAQADAEPSMVTVLVSKASTIAVIPPTSNVRTATQVASPATDLLQLSA